jgi:hypothetical protein
MLMSDYFMQQYKDWLSGKKTESTAVAAVENYYYRFLYGDLAPKQAYRSYAKYSEPHIIQEYLQ